MNLPEIHGWEKATLTITSRGVQHSVLIDERDSARVAAAGPWHLKRNSSGHLYVENGAKVLLHRFICAATRGLEVDHIDGNRLNDQRANLRLVSHAEQMQNRRKRADAQTSRFRGVSFHRGARKWVAEISIHGRKLHLGLFVDEEGAARAAQAARARFYTHTNETRHPAPSGFAASGPEKLTRRGRPRERRAIRLIEGT